METVVAFFFFKQKTAYEVRISDWSSDVCSSDLLVDQHGERRARPSEQHDAGDQRDAFLPDGADTQEPDMAVRANEDFMVLKQRRDALAQIAQARCFRRSEEHTSELQSLMRNSYAVFCLKKKNN